MTVLTRRCKLKACRKPLKRKRSASGKLENLGTWQARLYCDNACAHAARKVDADGKVRHCECGALLVRKRNSSGRLEPPRDFGRRTRCVVCTENAHRVRIAPLAPPQAKPTTKTTPAVPLKPVEATTAPVSAKLPDPRSRQPLTDNPRNESNMRRLPSLLEAERASGVAREPVTKAQLWRTLRRVGRSHPEFAAMLKGQEVREPVVGEVVV